MDCFIIRLYGVSAHFRDPRFNTGGIGNLPLRTLHSPPPCTLHGLLCAAKGGWVEPEQLKIGWRMDYASATLDFQTCRLPQRKSYNWTKGTQRKDPSPREREFLAYPVLTLLVIAGVDFSWFIKPVNPLCLGRSEDLVTMKKIEQITATQCGTGSIRNQCLPLGLGFGTIYPSPLYFDNDRTPVQMAPRTDARVIQQVRDKNMVRVEETQEVFYLWDFGNAIR